MKGVVDALPVTHTVEHKELWRRTEIASIANAGPLQVGLGLLGYVARIPAIILAGRRIPNIANENQSCLRGEWIDEGGGGVGHHQHVAFLYFLKSADRRAVEADALVERIAVH